MALTTTAKVGRFLGITFGSTTNPTSTQVDAIVILAVNEAYNLVSRFNYHELANNRRPSYLTGKDSDAGLANGTNKVFFVLRTPIVDYDDDGTFTDEVTVDIFETATDAWSKGAAVTSVDDKYGNVTLTTAPTATSYVYLDYRSYVAGSNPSASLMEKLANNLAAREIWQSPHWDGTLLADSYSIPGLSVTKTSSIRVAQVRKYDEEIRRLANLINMGRGVGVQ